MDKGRILLIICIVLFPVTLWFCMFLGEMEIFGTAGMMRYMWITFLVLPIYLIAILYGVKLWKQKKKFKVYVILPSIIST